jgi:hypothetical protein
MSTNHTIPASIEADALQRLDLLLALLSQAQTQISQPRREDYQRVLNQIRETYVYNHGKLPPKMRQALSNIEADLQLLSYWGIHKIFLTSSFERASIQLIPTKTISTVPEAFNDALLVLIHFENHQSKPLVSP